jgi:hypothetical protein
VLLVGIMAVACGEGLPSPDPAPGREGRDAPTCVLSPAPTSQSARAVVVAAPDPLCDLEFREVIALPTGRSEILPRPPAAIIPSGGYVTATFRAGYLAVWSASGEFVRLVGRGPGRGPGEFGHPGSLVVDPAGVIHVFSGGPSKTSYTLNGEYLGTSTPEGVSGLGSAGTGAGGSLLALARTPRGQRIVRWDADGSVRVDATGPDPGRALVLGVNVAEVWTALADTYELKRVEPDLDPERTTLGRDPPRLRSAPPGSWNLFGIVPESDGGIWVLLSVAADDAPEGPLPPLESPDDAARILSAYRDTMVELLSLDGRLLASHRFTDIGAAPTPMSASRWFIDPGDASGTLRIVEPVLTAR